MFQVAPPDEYAWMNRLRVRNDRPFGNMSRFRDFNLDGDTQIDEGKTAMLHALSARAHAFRFEQATGCRMRKDGHLGSPYKYDAIMKIVKSEFEKKLGDKGWQDQETLHADGRRTLEGEKESGGSHWYNNREEMGVFAETLQMRGPDGKPIDLNGVEQIIKDNAVRGNRMSLLYPRREDCPIDKEALQKQGMVLAQRTAFNASSNPDAMAINYLHDFQFQISHAGMLPDIMGQWVDIPAGYQTYQVPLLGYAQWFQQGGVTTESYTAIPAVTPNTSKQVWSTLKYMSSTWAEGEFDEDVVAAYLPAIERAYVLGAAIYKDRVLLLADPPSDNTNINCNGIAALGANDPRVGATGFLSSNYRGTILGGAAGAYKGVNMGGAAANLNMVSALRAKLGKYGLVGADLKAICAQSVRAQFVQDSKARPDTYSVLVKQGADGDIYSIDACPVLTMVDSRVTNASAGGMPNYTSWNSEGMPVNLAADGTYTGVGSMSVLLLINPRNWIGAYKRRYNFAAVKLPLSDQIAVVGSERFAINPIFPSVSEVVAYGIQV